MAALEDVFINLNPDQNFAPDIRTIRVDLSDRVDFDASKLEEQFGFNPEAITHVNVDLADKKGAIISLKKNIALTTVVDELSVTYYAKGFDGEQQNGRILFPEVEFEIGVAPIIFELDPRCWFPDKIIINVRDYNGNAPIILTSVGSNKYGAATITLSGNDYNNDFNGDFNFGSTSDPHKIITYRLNKNTDFWKTLNAEDEFQYNISYQGKTASNFIRVKLKK